MCVRVCVAAAAAAVASETINSIWHMAELICVDRRTAGVTHGGLQ